MTVKNICEKEVVTISSKDSILKAAQTMRECHVGTVIVVRDDESQMVPVGVLTDRDIVMLVVAHHVDPQQVSVEDVMSKRLISVNENDGIFEVIKKMKKNGVRRVPVINNDGQLTGILSAEDLFSLLGREIYELTGYQDSEHNRERARLDLFATFQRQAEFYTDVR